MINRIFLSKRKNKNFIDSHNPRSSLFGDSLEERNKLNEIKLISNLFNMKLTQNYIDKCSLLLHTCHQTKNYPYIRQNIDKTIYQYNKNNELCITLPKFFEDQKSNDIQTNEIIFPKKKYSTIDASERNSISRQNFFRTGSKLKKNTLNRNTLFNRETFDNNFFEHMTLPKILTNSNIFSNNNMKSSRTEIMNINQSKNPEMTTTNIFEENEDTLNDLRNNQKRIFSYISELNLLNPKENSNSKKDKKRNNVYYQNVFINNQKNGIPKLYSLNKKNKKEDEVKLSFEDQMEKMKNDIYKLNEESHKTENEVNTTIQNIERFLNKKGLSANGILQFKNNHFRSQKKAKYNLH